MSKESSGLCYSATDNAEKDHVEWSILENELVIMAYFPVCLKPIPAAQSTVL